MAKDEIDPFFIEVGKRLLRARLAKNMPQNELATRVGTTAQNIWNWENGYALLPPAKASDLRRVLGIDANYLYMDLENALAPEISAEIAKVESKKRVKRRNSPRQNK